ncbi:MAG: hypothetical protein IIZ78_06095 [Clostridiales bacterium]|nr:hypothetical protein [Clostridiales bacterium]
MKDLITYIKEARTLKDLKGKQVSKIEVDDTSSDVYVFFCKKKFSDIHTLTFMGPGIKLMFPSANRYIAMRMGVDYKDVMDFDIDKNKMPVYFVTRFYGLPDIEKDMFFNMKTLIDTDNLISDLQNEFKNINFIGVHNVDDARELVKKYGEFQ